MAHLFISYSRVDKDFVAKLHDGLEELGHSAWVDWEGIPASSYFLEEILPAIDAAAAYITVISPDYVKSEYCRLELEYAVANSKRIIPLVLRTTEREKIPDPLGDIHWTFFDAPSKFKERLEDLADTIDTDLEWTREHARLLVRARSWEIRLKQYSLLLRGRGFETGRGVAGKRTLGRRAAHTVALELYQAQPEVCGIVSSVSNGCIGGHSNIWDPWLGTLQPL